MCTKESHKKKDIEGYKLFSYTNLLIIKCFLKFNMKKYRNVKN